MKRFWSTVSVDADRVVMLDARPVRTPGRVPLAAPTDALAAVIADEWRAVEGDVDPRAMPLTGLANAAIDLVAPDRAGFAAGLAAYGETDLLCYRAELPEPLVDRQRAAWDPLLGWARARYDIHLETTAGVIHVAQPLATVQRLADAIASYDAFRLAAAAPIVTLTGSLIVTLALLDHAADADTIWAAAHVDEDWQAEMWGEDYLAIETRAAQRSEYDAAIRFLALL
ncbi:ATP12 family chaperone protein [Sphingomonas oligophenolica]|uniref:ATPase n=1 Tax=Sphingomonas oligophenolica TaxID=301154 RepID=A0A502CE41_9SPHN|nr:ATP12 family protein [Sphingomonas oligophenolica]TPG10950.1 ATPase [Sphingomonas oligophenolica]